ncbi:MAG: HAD family hydrolase [Polyangiales bacterium]
MHPKQTHARKAAFFDVDRTLVAAHTGALYMRWRHRRGEVGWPQRLQVGSWIAQATLGWLDAARVCERALQMFAGMQEAALQAQCRSFFASDVVPHLSHAARAQVRAHQQRGDVCVIVTAATRYIASCVADTLHIDQLLCTELEVRDGRLTGALGGPLCYGDGKLSETRRWAERAGVDLAESAFYTDSISDLPLLQGVGHPVVVNPDPRLAHLASRQGWPCYRWSA